MDQLNTPISRILARLLALLAISAAGFFMWGMPENSGVDYLHFWAVPAYVQSAPSKSLYDASSHASAFEWIRNGSTKQKNARLNSLVANNGELYKDRIAPTGTPFLYAAFGVTRTGNFWFDYRLFQFVSLVAATGGIFLLGKMAGYRDATCFGIVAGIFFLCSPLSIDTSVANTNRIQLGLIAVAFWLASRKTRWSNVAIAGAILGLSVAFKPNTLLVPALLVLAELLSRRLSRAVAVLAGAGLGVAAGVASGAIFFGGVSVWGQWSDYLQTQLREPFPMDTGNYTWVAAVDPSWQSTVSMVAGVVLLSLIVCGVWLATRGAELAKSDGANSGAVSMRCCFVASLGLLVPLLSASIAWSHYYLLAMPTVILLAQKIGYSHTMSNQDKFKLGAWALGTAMVAAVPVSLLGITNPKIVAGVLGGGSLILLLVSVSCLNITSDEQTQTSPPPAEPSSISQNLPA